MPSLRVVGGEKATVTEAYRAAEYLRALFGDFRGNLGEFRRQVQAIRRLALSDKDEMFPGGVTFEKATHLYRAFNCSEEVVA